jgi:hypothetical protein
MIFGVIATVILYWKGTSLGLKMPEVVANIVQVWICVASFISATFVISSYVQTNAIFVLSQKPHLLLQVVGGNDSNENHHTIILYTNRSASPFYDLSLFITISTPNTTIDLSDLFSPKMYMASHDQRQRDFVTLTELEKHNFDLAYNIEKKQEIVLSLSYQFTFNNEQIKIDVQKYKWDVEHQDWSIK